ncbi:MAG: ABC transporter permease subunit, partial [Ferrovibrionaceae bacterium]
GQISLGTGAFMAVGAYAAYNLQVRIEGLPLLLALIGGGLCAMALGIVFGIPSLRIRGLYLAVATLAAQFFVDWFVNRAAWVTNHSTSGLVSIRSLDFLGMALDTPARKYLLCLTLLVVLGLMAKN